MGEIRLYGDPILRKRAKAVEASEPVSELVEHMLRVMYEADGVGLAAPQVGVSKRVAVIDLSPVEDYEEKLVLINPVILERSEEEEAEEGCLSLPGLRRPIARSAVVLFSFTDLEGNRRKYQARGLASRVIQHEIDHLNGVLFIDHLTEEDREEALREWGKLRQRQE